MITDVLRICCVVPKNRKNPYTEHYEKLKVDEFLNLKRLAIILENLVESFPGVFSVLIQLYVC